MIARLALLALAVAAGAASAQQGPIPVRTAEHVGFTRIVIDFAGRPAWRLGREDGAYELRTDPPALTYDLSDVYRRITGARIDRLTPAADGGLRIETACLCHLVTEELAGGGLVIDIRDGDAPPGNPHEAALRDERPVPAPREAPRETRPVPIPAVAPANTAPAVLPMPAPAQTTDDATLLRDALAEDVRLAAAMDILDAAPLVSPSPPPAAAPADTADVDQPGLPPNLRIRTEAEAASDTQAPGLRSDPSVCARHEVLLDPTDWAEPGLGPGGIRLDHDGLLDIRGQTDPEGHLVLALQYLYLSFGREALATLAPVRDAIPEAALYAAVAEIVDGATPATHPLGGLADCPGHAGLWAVLADPSTRVRPAERDAVPAFSEWSVELRRALGPRLVAAFLDAGETETAAALFRILSRVAIPEDPGFLLVASRLSGSMAAEEAALRRVAASPDPQASGALVDLIEARIAESVPVGTDLAMQAGAMAFELADQPAAEDLQAAEIRALVHDGHWHLSLDRLEAAGPVSARGALLSDLVLAAAARASDGDLIRLGARVEGDAGLSPEARLALTWRMIDLGLAEAARRALDLGAAIPTPLQRHALAAIALLEGELDLAEAHLAGLDDPEAARLMEEVASRRDRRAMVETAVAETPAPVAAPPRDEAARKDAAPSADPARASGLAASRALLGDVAELRKDLNALLR